MTRNDINYRSPGFYDPERRSPKTNTIIVIIFCGLDGRRFFGASLARLDEQQKLHCQQGWQPACEKLNEKNSEEFEGQWTLPSVVGKQAHVTIGLGSVFPSLTSVFGTETTQCRQLSKEKAAIGLTIYGFQGTTQKSCRKNSRCSEKSVALALSASTNVVTAHLITPSSRPGGRYSIEEFLDLYNEDFYERTQQERLVLLRKTPCGWLASIKQVLMTSSME